MIVVQCTGGQAALAPASSNKRTCDRTKKKMFYFLLFLSGIGRLGEGGKREKTLEKYRDIKK